MSGAVSLCAYIFRELIDACTALKRIGVFDSKRVRRYVVLVRLCQ